MIKLKVNKRKLIALSVRTRKTSTSVSKLIIKNFLIFLLCIKSTRNQNPVEWR
jgi:hypothetical protein